ncbi:GTP-dependent dephospho-CoA kinase family protein [Candidatus Bathyarchaeota archaeon]|nr:GTP-dependent dephospho-CoA kinase family protein [Candidatus Bathyarchaeota archaeon]
MIHIRFLTPDLREELKTPLGLLVQGSYKQTMIRLKEIIAKDRPKKIVSVGDKVTENIIKSGIPLNVAIIDNKVMRKPVKPLDLKADRSFNVRNPAGSLNEEAFQVISEAVIFDGLTSIRVDGEEDLLTLAAIIAAPFNSIVVYGQPKKGIVIVSVTEDVKKKINGIIERMEKQN